MGTKRNKKKKITKKFYRERARQLNGSAFKKIKVKRKKKNTINNLCDNFYTKHIDIILELAKKMKLYIKNFNFNELKDKNEIKKDRGYRLRASKLYKICLPCIYKQHEDSINNFIRVHESKINYFECRVFNALKNLSFLDENYKIYNNFIINSPKYGFIICEIDILVKKNNVNIFIIEVKEVGEITFKRVFKRNDKNIILRKANPYYHQIQTQMFCAHVKKSLLVVKNKEEQKYYILTIDIDFKFFNANKINYLFNFWAYSWVPVVYFFKNFDQYVDNYRCLSKNEKKNLEKKISKMKEFKNLMANYLWKKVDFNKECNVIGQLGVKKIVKGLLLELEKE